MNTSEPNPFETKHLFRHKYDIDTIIQALCTGTPQAINTGVNTYPIQQLPASFLIESLTHPSLAKQSETTQATIHTLAQTPLEHIAQHFHTQAGDWLRARVKDAALEWLDAHNLIPPSMTHVPRQTRSLQTKPRKVSIT